MSDPITRVREQIGKALADHFQEKFTVWGDEFGERVCNNCGWVLETREERRESNRDSDRLASRLRQHEIDVIAQSLASRLAREKLDEALILTDPDLLDAPNYRKALVDSVLALMVEGEA